MLDKLKEAINKVGSKINTAVTSSTVVTYNKETGNGLFETLTDKGNFGEFLSYKKLSALPGYYRAVFNIYLPKGNGQTTEIDLVFIHETGIYVIESKNYSGWIFGKEKDLKWMQVLKGGKKYPFYNPIKQNIGHIGALQTLLPSIQQESYKSMIVFSERCTLKKVQFESPNTFVVKRNDLKQVMLKQIDTSPTILEKEHVNRIYNFLSEFSKVDYTTKKEHIQRIN